VPEADRQEGSFGFDFAENLAKVAGRQGLGDLARNGAAPNAGLFLVVTKIIIRHIVIADIIVKLKPIRQGQVFALCDDNPAQPFLAVEARLAGSAGPRNGLEQSVFPYSQQLERRDDEPRGYNLLQQYPGSGEQALSTTARPLGYAGEREHRDAVSKLLSESADAKKFFDREREMARDMKSKIERANRERWA
jgi:hypothetical protein